MGEKLKQRNLTIHLAVAYLDLMMHQPSFSEERQELLALTCLLLSSKFDELDDNIPLIREFQKAARQKNFSYAQVQECEIEVL